MAHAEDAPAVATRRFRGWLLAGGLVFIVAALLVGRTYRGSVIEARFAPNHGADFDFTVPPCGPATAPVATDGDVLVRYLGVGGIYIKWRGQALLTAPFFSNHSVMRTGLGTIRWNHERIEHGMDDIDTATPIGVVLVGHSHYDHIGDVPPIVERWAPGAEVWANRTGQNMLAHCAQLGGNRVRTLQELEGQWTTPLDATGQPLPFRVLPIRSAHASHAMGIKLASGSVDEPWDDCLEGRPVRKLVDGQPYAFLIDLLNETGDTVYRLHYQDAASGAPFGFPPTSAIDARPVDLAVTCMPSWYNAHDYPRGVLRATRARHVLATHYETFIGEPDGRFVPLLTNSRANGFLEVVQTEMARDEHVLHPPRETPCGPASRAWTMPLPGEWLRFSTDR